MIVTYSIPDFSESDKFIDVVFSNSDNQTLSRRINLPRSRNGVINHELLQKNLDLQVVGVEREFAQISTLS